MKPHTNNMLIVIPFDLPWEHTADYTHQTALELSKQNTVVCYMQKDAKSLREYFAARDPSLFLSRHSVHMYVYYPLYIFPFRRFAIVEQLNSICSLMLFRLFMRFLFGERAFTRRILWLFSPEYAWMIPFFGRTFESLYDCVDYHVSASNDPIQQAHVSRLETQLLSQATYVTVNSQTLFSIHKNKREDIVVVPQGFRLHAFQRKQEIATLPYPKPIIGYIGGVNRRMNYALVEGIAKKFSFCTIIIVGPLQDAVGARGIRRLLKHPGVVWIGDMPKYQIAGVVSSFDIGIIPYDVSSAYNRYSFPMKVFEYFYMGKPVIATPIVELKRFANLVKIGSTVSEWEKHINNLVSKQWPSSYKKKQRRLAMANSWNKKINAILRIIDSDQTKKK
jgi:glycosyltransferase involved in cell wall biosynthesis